MGVVSVPLRDPMVRGTKMRVLPALTFAMLAAVPALTAGGCADSESMLFIRGVLVPDAQECTVTAEPSQPLFQRGVLDVELRDNYLAALLIGNQLTQRGDRAELKTETNRVALEGAEVRVFTASDALITEFTVPGVGFVDQGGTSDPSYGSLSAVLIDGATGSALQNQLSAGGFVTVISRVKVFGTTLGGIEVESNELAFPITVCRGCLISFPANQVQAGCDPAQLVSNEEDEACITCNYGQDTEVCCADCFNNSDLCRP